MAVCGNNLLQLWVGTANCVDDRDDWFFDPNSYLFDGAWHSANWMVYLINMSVPDWPNDASLGLYHDSRVKLHSRVRRPAQLIACHDATYHYGLRYYGYNPAWGIRIYYADAGYCAYYMSTGSSWRDYPCGIGSIGYSHKARHQAVYVDGHVHSYSEADFPIDEWAGR